MQNSPCPGRGRGTPLPRPSPRSVMQRRASFTRSLIIKMMYLNGHAQSSMLSFCPLLFGGNHILIIFAHNASETVFSGSKCKNFPALGDTPLPDQGRRNVFSFGGRQKKGTVMSKRALTVYVRIIITNAFIMKHHCRHGFFLHV